MEISGMPISADTCADRASVSVHHLLAQIDLQCIAIEHQRLVRLLYEASGCRKVRWFFGCTDGVAVWQPMLRTAGQAEAAPHQRLHNVLALRAVGDAPRRAVLGHPGSPAPCLGAPAGRPGLHVPAARHGPGVCQGRLSNWQGGVADFEA